MAVSIRSLYLIFIAFFLFLDHISGISLILQLVINSRSALIALSTTPPLDISPSLISNSGVRFFIGSSFK